MIVHTRDIPHVVMFINNQVLISFISTQKQLEMYKQHFENVFIGGRLELSAFSQANTAYIGRERSRAAVRFFKMSLMVHRDFEKGSRNQNFQSTLLGGREGVTKKSTLCTLLTMLTIFWTTP